MPPIGSATASPTTTQGNNGVGTNVPTTSNQTQVTQAQIQRLLSPATTQYNAAQDQLRITAQYGLPSLLLETQNDLVDVMIPTVQAAAQASDALMKQVAGGQGGGQG